MGKANDDKDHGSAPSRAPNSTAPKPGGGLVERLRPSGYTTLFGTREHSCYASSQVSVRPKGFPPSGPNIAEREVEREEARANRRA